MTPANQAAQPHITYTDRQGKVWTLTDIRESDTPGFVTAQAEGKRITIHRSAVKVEEVKK